MLLHLFFMFISVESMQHYHRHKVFRVAPRSERDLERTLEFQRHLEAMGVDIWHMISSSGHGGFLDFRLTEEMTFILKDLEVKYEVLIPDVQDLIDKEFIPKTVKREAVTNSFDYERFHNFDEIQLWMESLKRKYGNIIQLFSVAESFEGRSVAGLKISVSSESLKREVWLQAGLHAREWLGPAALMYIAHQLLQRYNVDAVVTAVLDRYDVYIVPVVNPDGYTYTFTNDRLWRKNRHRRLGSICTGVDLNRNWDLQWSGLGSDSSSCSEIYHGPAPFSENETAGVAEFILKNTTNIVAFIDLHTYGQLWLSPWGYTASSPTDSIKQLRASEVAVEALREVYGTDYKYGQIASTLYYASGVVTDWTYGVANITYTIGAELRDMGRHGFLVPQSEIKATGEETLQGIMAYLRYVDSQLLADTTHKTTAFTSTETNTSTQLLAGSTYKTTAFTSTETDTSTAATTTTHAEFVTKVFCITEIIFLQLSPF